MKKQISSLNKQSVHWTNPSPIFATRKTKCYSKIYKHLKIGVFWDPRIFWSWMIMNSLQCYHYNDTIEMRLLWWYLDNVFLQDCLWRLDDVWWVLMMFSYIGWPFMFSMTLIILHDDDEQHPEEPKFREPHLVEPHLGASQMIRVISSQWCHSTDIPPSHWIKQQNFRRETSMFWISSSKWKRFIRSRVASRLLFYVAQRRNINSQKC